MKCKLLIYDNEEDLAAMPPDAQQRVHGGYMRFTQEIKASGHCLAGDPLQPVQTATTVRIHSGKTSMTDGSFAETCEQLSGYYLIEAKDLDETTKIASRVPSARLGSIEVRPVQNLEG